MKDQRQGVSTMSAKRAGIAAAALLLMTALNVTPAAAAPDPGVRQAEDFHFSAAGAGSLTDMDLRSADQVIANHKLRCSC
jgi:hypothetical protein